MAAFPSCYRDLGGFLPILTDPVKAEYLVPSGLIFYNPIQSFPVRLRSLRLQPVPHQNVGRPVVGVGGQILQFLNGRMGFEVGQ